jgi:hypothetical protein
MLKSHDDLVSARELLSQHANATVPIRLVLRRSRDNPFPRTKSQQLLPAARLAKLVLASRRDRPAATVAPGPEAPAAKSQAVLSAQRAIRGLADRARPLRSSSARAALVTAGKPPYTVGCCRSDDRGSA